jgi:hypothetical protein
VKGQNNALLLGAVAVGFLTGVMVGPVVVRARAPQNPDRAPQARQPVVSEAQYERWKTELSVRDFKFGEPC